MLRAGCCVLGAVQGAGCPPSRRSRFGETAPKLAKGRAKAGRVLCRVQGAASALLGAVLAAVLGLGGGAVAWAGTQPSGELIERTLAIVGGQVITLSDVRTAMALHLVEGEAGVESVEAVTSRLIDRVLMLREVQHYAPPEPPGKAVDDRVALARDRFPSEEAFAAALAAGGFSAERLRAWIRDDLRVAAYLDQRFAAAGVPNEQEVTAYYNQHKAEFEQGGVAFADAVPLIRERLSGERRRELITDWLSDLRRRTEVIRLSTAGTEKANTATETQRHREDRSTAIFSSGVRCPTFMAHVCARPRHISAASPRLPASCLCVSASLWPNWLWPVAIA